MFSVRKEAGLFTFYYDEPDDPLQFETSREAFLYAIQNSVWDCFAVVLNDAAPESQQYQTHFVYNKDLAAHAPLLYRLYTDYKDAMESAAFLCVHKGHHYALVVNGIEQAYIHATTKQEILDMPNHALTKAIRLGGLERNPSQEDPLWRPVYYGAAGQTVDQPSVFVALVPEKVTSK